MGYFTKTALAVAILATSLVVFSVIQSNDGSKNLNDGDNLDCGFTQDFSDFIKSNGTHFAYLGYATFQFDRPDIKCGTFGGKTNSTAKLKKIPVIFIHGNSDVAFGRGTTDGYVAWQTGFRSLATYLVAQGWDKSDLYTTTWGPADPNQAQNNYHSKKTVMYLRAFVEAVLAYTKAKEIIVIGHSMGVSLARRVIKGG
jgi:triacylglycerol lipase